MSTFNGKNTTAKDLENNEAYQQGKIVIVGVSDEKDSNDGKKRRTVYIRQKLETAAASLVAKLNGWKNERMNVANFNVVVEQIPVMEEVFGCKIEEGGVMGEGFNIQVQRSHIQSWDTQSPVINPQTNEVLQIEGMDIYENTELVEGQPNNILDKDVIAANILKSRQTAAPMPAAQSTI